VIKDRIAVANAPSDVGSINRMSEDMIEALAARGYETVQFDARIPAQWTGLAACGINTLICYGGGISYATQMAPVLRGINTLLVGLDHPAHWIDDFRQFRSAHMGQSAFTVPTQSNIAFVRNQMDHAHVHCLRHSAKTVEALPMDRRTGTIVVAGNYTPEDEFVAAVARQPPRFLAAFTTALETLKARETLTLEDAVSPHFLDPHGHQREAFNWLCVMVDRTVRSLVRRAALQALNGHRVEVIGRGWDALDLPGTVTVKGEMDAPDAVSLFGNAAIVVNTMPYYVESHERLYEAAAHGAAIVTAVNPYNRALFSQCGALYQSESEIGDLCSGLLSDPDGLAAMGQAGERLIEDQEGWHHRIAEILDLLAAKDDVPPHSLHRRYDLILDMRVPDAKPNLSVTQLSRGANVLISVSPERMSAAGNLFAQAGRYLPPQSTITIVTDRSVPNGFFDEAAQVLSQNGYQPLEATHAQTYGALTVRKG